jgi:peptidoglycan/xylan/chitin deacetylase (PgdA/CDA1 family)
LNTAKHLRRSGLKAFFPFYHAVSNHALPHTKYLYAIRNTARFEADLEYLLRFFEPLSMGEYLEGKGDKNHHKPWMMMSFDDGLIQCYQEIMPILLRKGIPATFFLNNDFIDNKGLFFRFKISLLLEQLPDTSEAEKVEAAGILQCRVGELEGELRALGYPDDHLCDRIARCWNFGFRDYLTEHPVYLSTRHIREMIGQGFEFGSHGFDHPRFSGLSPRDAINHIRQSTEDLQVRFGLDYRYFAFPFTDHGVHDTTIGELFSSGIIDAGFGTAGLKEDPWPRYFQRVPMEFRDLDARLILKGELNRRLSRRILRNNRVKRGKIFRQL